MIEQIIWTGNEYEVADRTNSEQPEWPVQDKGAHWNREKFDGQRVVFRQSHVHFGFLVEPVADADIPRDADGDPDLDGLFLCNNGRVYKAV